MWQITGALAVALALTGGAFKLYMDKSEAEKESMALQLRQAADNEQVLERSISGLNKQLLATEAKQEAVLERINQLQDDYATAQKEVESIRKKFAKHDMNMLSLRKPVLIEKIINKGTKEVLGDLETITNPDA
mgnify:CR=1 FL=1